MILGKIIGKITTLNFDFIVEGDAQKFEYIQVMHKDYDYVLCQIIEIERKEDTIAKCTVIGYLNEGRVCPIRTPFEPGTEVLRAQDEFIKAVIDLGDSKGAYIGLLEGKSIPVHIDLKKLLTKHVAVLAKSGSGKSYTVGVLMEEIIEQNVPLLIIDPHGEYSSLKQKNTDELNPRFNVQPKSFAENIQEYGDKAVDPSVKNLYLDEHLNTQELINLLPGKLSSAQLNLLYGALTQNNTSNAETQNISFASILNALELEENPAKHGIINIIDYLKQKNIFSETPTELNELVQSGKCTIINLRGIDPETQEIIVSKLMSDLFQARKIGKIPPFFAVIEEAHNFAPERSFGEKKTSNIMRTIASEGRKFGLGLCIISQRPARVDKSVLSQCSTQIILKVTNPNDLRAVCQSVEGITSNAENEIQNLTIGTAMITGIVDAPLFVNIRPRKTAHGGESVDMLEDSDFMDDLQEFNEKELLPIIEPKLTPKDIQLMSDREIKSIETILSPAIMFICNRPSPYNILFDLIKGGIAYQDKTILLPNFDKLSDDELKLLKLCFRLKEFTREDLNKEGLDTGRNFQKLIDEGYIEDNSNNYNITDKYLLTNPSRKACFEKINYVQTQYTTKSDPKLTVDEAKQQLSKFVDIIDAKECWLVHHKVDYS